MIPLDCMLPADLAIYICNPLIGLLAHKCARVAGILSTKQKGRSNNDENSECIRDRPVKLYVDYQLIVGKEKF